MPGDSGPCLARSPIQSAIPRWNGFDRTDHRNCGAQFLSPPGQYTHGGGRRSLPTVGLYGLLSSRIFRSWNLSKFMAEKNRELGPVFQIRAPSRRLVVFANAEMNRWVGHKGRLFRQLGDREDHIRRDGLPATKTSTRTHSGTLCPD